MGEGLESSEGEPGQSLDVVVLDEPADEKIRSAAAQTAAGDQRGRSQVLEVGQASERIVRQEGEGVGVEEPGGEGEGGVSKHHKLDLLERINTSLS